LWLLQNGSVSSVFTEKRLLNKRLAGLQSWSRRGALPNRLLVNFDIEEYFLARKLCKKMEGEEKGG